MDAGDQKNEQAGKNTLAISNSINIAHIITTIVMVFTVGVDIKTTIATNTAEIANLKSERTREALELKDSIRELNLKVDRLIERGTHQLSYKSYENK